MGIGSAVKNKQELVGKIIHPNTWLTLSTFGHPKLANNLFQMTQSVFKYIGILSITCCLCSRFWNMDTSSARPLPSSLSWILPLIESAMQLFGITSLWRICRRSSLHLSKIYPNNWSWFHADKVLPENWSSPDLGTLRSRLWRRPHCHVRILVLIPF